MPLKWMENNGGKSNNLENKKVYFFASDVQPGFIRQTIKIIFL